MRKLRAALFALAVVVTPLGVSAQAEESAAESRAAVFEAARGAQTEQVPGGGLLVAAYGAIWLLLLAYLISLGLRQSKLARDLDRLRQDLQAAEKRER